MKKKFIAIIPARGGSKKIKNKNSKFLNGQPLISYTIEAAKNSKIHKVFVSTDSSKISSICKMLDVEVINRPMKLSTDKTLMLPVLQHAIKNINYEFDAVVTLQPTSPLRTSKHINAALRLYEADVHSDSLVSVMRIPHNMEPFSALRLKKNGYLENFSSQNNFKMRRQDKKTFYARNGPAIIITDKNVVKKSMYGKKLQLYLMSYIESLDIDNKEDWINAERTLSQRY